MAVTFPPITLLTGMAFEIDTVLAMADSRTLELTIDRLMGLVDAVLEASADAPSCPSI